MASSEYHRKQAEILAGLALASPDPASAYRLSLMAREHRALADKLADNLAAKLQAGQPPRPPSPNEVGQRDSA